MREVYVLTFLLLGLLPVSGGTVINTTSIRDRIPAMLKILCPESDVCTNASDIVFIKDSCCTDCSCDQNCKERHNCCFPDENYRTHREEQKVRQDVNHSHINKEMGGHSVQPQSSSVFECLFPFSKQPVDAKEKIKSNTFWMISHSIDDVNLQTGSNCGEKKVAPWGNIWPASSNTTGNIYKNIACAAAHNVSDVVMWKAVLICDMLDHTLQNQRDSISFENDHFPDYCVVHFNNPQDMPVPRSNICYTKLIDTCLENDFDIPKGLALPRQDIIEACNSGLLSPFRKKDLFANVFCHICSGEEFIIAMKCTLSHQPGILESIGKRKFTALINPILEEGRPADRMSQDYAVKACLPDDEQNTFDRCKPVLCPSGQLRDIGGKCIQLTSSWLQTNVVLCIKLLPDQPFPFRQILGNKLNDISSLKSPWPKQWYIHSIFCKEIGSVIMTDEIVIFLTKTLSQHNPVRLLRKIKRLMKEPWRLELHNTTIVLKADFWEFKRLYPATMPSFPENITVGNYKRLYLATFFFPENPIFITKLYFCEQVQLKGSEFIVLESNLLMFNKITRQYLYNSQFSLHEAVIDGTVEAHVCVEDSGFRTVKTGGFHSGSILLCLGVDTATVLILFIIETLVQL